MTLLDQIMGPGGLSVVFQPILEVLPHGVCLHSVEALTRGPQGTNVEPPDVLFDFVRRKNAECEVDRACVREIFSAARRLPQSLPFSINIHASTLARDHEFQRYFVESAETNAVTLGRVTLEIVEHAPPWDGPSFQAGLGRLRDVGVKIALDDVGLGQSNYKMILDCRPDYFKIDRYFVKDLQQDSYRRMVVESISNLAHSFGGEAVAEGVETVEELEVLRNLGVDLVQGYLFSRAITVDEIGAWMPFAAHAPIEGRASN